MKNPRMILIPLGAVAALAFAAALFHAWWQEGMAEPLDVPRLMTALQGYHRDHPGIESVKVVELVQGRYVSADALATLVEQDAVVSLKATGRNPSEPLVWSRGSDGSYFVILADGSVHQLSQAAAQAVPGLLQKSPPPGGAR